MYHSNGSGNIQKQQSSTSDILLLTTNCIYHIFKRHKPFEKFWVFFRFILKRLRAHQILVKLSPNSINFLGIYQRSFYLINVFYDHQISAFISKNRQSEHLKKTAIILKRRSLSHGYHRSCHQSTVWSNRLAVIH